ncbi:glycosyltransferase [filamentous cyanobacterium LEGE 11480]|uniref:Glycosyltransferase n=1 Tax=Romeriopsis navalis LEGE 11480 TaxID=2777977 RepID=A0A928Z311_9CYAN|nr:glycosyltransferase [Romeriopsis navalis]MBE9028698.1 glycosyltransferase [Romeriopsis navalis LEGE 11480]
MKKLLIITTIPESLEAFFLHFARHFQRLGWQVDGMANKASQHPDCIDAFNRVWDIEISRNPLALSNFLTAPKQIRQAYLAEQYDLVLMSTPTASFIGRYALNQFRRQGRVKVIYTAQGFHFYKGASWLRNLAFLSLEKIAAPWTDYIVTVNQEDEQSARQHQLAAATKIRRIPGTGVDLDRFSRGRIKPHEIAAVRLEMGIPQDVPMLLSLAEFIPRKRHWDVLRAFALVPQSTAHLVLAGDGPLEGAMRQLADQLGIGDRVHFIGFRRDAPRLIQAATATILMSAQEGLPNCVMESMYLNVPVIGSNIRGTQDLLQQGCGLLVEVGDVATLSQAMYRVMTQPDLRQQIAQQAQARLGAYDRANVLATYEALYNEALNDQSNLGGAAAIPSLN